MKDIMENLAEGGTSENLTRTAVFVIDGKGYSIQEIEEIHKKLFHSKSKLSWLSLLVIPLAIIIVGLCYWKKKRRSAGDDQLGQPEAMPLSQYETVENNDASSSAV